MWPVRKLIFLQLLCLGFSLHADLEETFKEYDNHAETKFVIGTTGAGFFWSFFGVLNNLYWCDLHGKIPVVWWGRNSWCLYYQEEEYNGVKDNAWEYYFEPVSSLTYSPEDKIYSSHYVQDNLISWFDEKQYASLLDKPYKRKVNTLINKYIVLKPCVKDKIDKFYEEQMKGRKVIGIHLRGTDKKSEVEPIPIEKICAMVNESTKELTDRVFLVCTDEAKLLAGARQLLDGTIITYDVFRSTDGIAVHINTNHGYSMAKLGEEVLIEAILLSKCDMFFHTCSNVSSAVTFFNPELDNRLLLPGHDKPLES